MLKAVYYFFCLVAYLVFPKCQNCFTLRANGIEFNFPVGGTAYAARARVLFPFKMILSADCFGNHSNREKVTPVFSRIWSSP
jgi:hypothetical protein